MPTVIQTIQNAVRIAGTIVEAAVLSNPSTTVEQVTAVVERNSDLMVNHVITNPVMEQFADTVVNEIIATEIPPLYNQALLKLGGLPATGTIGVQSGAANPT